MRILPDQKDVEMLAKELAYEIELLAPDELWIPMGLGIHVDHLTTRSACIRVLAEAHDRFANVPVQMYEDLPYATDDHAVQIQRAFAAQGTRLVRGTEDVTDVFEEKLRAVSVYGSQFKLSEISSRLRESAELAAGTGGKALAEVYYQVKGEPRLPLESDLSLDLAGLKVLRAEMTPLIEARHRCSRLSVIAFPSAIFGKWKTEQDRILAAFPNADICLYVSEGIEWQIEETGDDRVKIHVVRKGLRGWLGVFLRELFRIGTPTIVLWWGSYRAESSLKRNLIKSSLWVRKVLFAKSLNDVCTLLYEQVGNLQSPDLKHNVSLSEG